MLLAYYTLDSPCNILARTILSDAGVTDAAAAAAAVALTALDRVSECRLLLNTVLPYSGTSGVVSTYGVCVDENLPMQNVFSGEHFFHEFAANYFSLPPCSKRLATLCIAIVAHFIHIHRGVKDRRKFGGRGNYWMTSSVK